MVFCRSPDRSESFNCPPILSVRRDRPRAAFYPARRCRAAASPDLPFVHGAAFTEDEGQLCGLCCRSLRTHNFRGG